MKQVELSQDELKVILTILLQIQYKLTDSKIILPIVEKLEANLDPEPVAQEGLVQPN